MENMEAQVVETTTEVAEAQVAESTPAEVTTEPSFIDSIPETFRDKGYLKGVDSMDQLMTKLDWAQSQMGKKGLPSEDTPEAWKAFSDTLKDNEHLKGMFAETAPEEYEFELADGMQESGVNKAKEIAKSLGLSQDKFNSLVNGWNEYEQEMLQAKQEADETEFSKMFEDKFGNDWADKMADATQLIRKHVDEDVRQMLSDIPNNKHLVALVSAAEQLRVGMQPDGAPASMASRGLSINELRDQMNAAREEAKSKPFDKMTQDKFLKIQDEYANRVAQG